MSNQIRIFRSGAVYRVTNYTYRGELRLTPDEAVEVFVEGCLARAARRCGVRLIAFTVMGNHFHMLVEVPLANLHAFMLYFQRELSTRLNLYRGVSKTNFPERYDHQEILDVEAFESAVAEILCNPVRARLVYEVAEWPGVSSVEMHRSGTTRRTVRHATRTQASAMREDGLTPELLRSFEEVELALSPPTLWADLEPGEVQARIADLVDIEEARLQREIDEARERVRGPSRIRDETHRQRPETVRWRPLRLCVSSDDERAAEYERWYAFTTRVYRRAAKLWRREGKWGAYPPGTFPPGWLECLPPAAGMGPPLPWTQQLPAAA